MVWSSTQLRWSLHQLVVTVTSREARGHAIRTQLGAWAGVANAPMTWAFKRGRGPAKEAFRVTAAASKAPRQRGGCCRASLTWLFSFAFSASSYSYWGLGQGVPAIQPRSKKSVRGWRMDAIACLCWSHAFHFNTTQEQGAGGVVGPTSPRPLSRSRSTKSPRP